MFFLKFLFLCVLFSGSNGVGRDFCQPGDPTCWPTNEEINQFRNSLSTADANCLRNFPTFTSKDHEGGLIINTWYDDVEIFTTPYYLLNLRQFFHDRKAYFVILARTQEDISNAVQFASKHNLALSVFSTGHEFQDRNGAMAPNGLLIRTTCLRTVEIDLDSDNRFGHPDGIIRLGSGMTWGTSKYKMKGVHEIARDNSRVVVSGHAAEVGIVGWSMGGGHSPLGPLHGLGVDQMLEVELVGADGSYIIANEEGTSVKSADGTKVEHIDNNDLFWAVRGGGAGPWGVVTAMTVKLHLPRDNCASNCYITNTVFWVNNFYADGGEMYKNLTMEFLHWAASASKYWSGYYFTSPGENAGEYYVGLSEFMYQGSESDEDAMSLSNTFLDLYPENRLAWNTKKYDTYFDKTKDQAYETVYVADKYGVWTSVLLNSTTMLENAERVADTLMKNWFQKCAVGEICNLSYMMHRTLPLDDSAVTGTSVSKNFREGDLHITTSLVYNPLNPEMPSDEEAEWVHNVLSPALYELGEAAYYSESEYSMENGQWQERLWDKETYDRLLNIKNLWDPEHLFECRHCVGDEEPALDIGPSTLPSWRYFTTNLNQLYNKQ